LCYVREHLDEHRLTAHKCGCGIRGEISDTTDKTCFYHHPSFGCGICGEMFDSKVKVKICFSNHIRCGCGICGEMYDTRDQVKTCFSCHFRCGCGICGEMSYSRDEAKTCFYKHLSTQWIDSFEGIFLIVFFYMWGVYVCDLAYQYWTNFSNISSWAYSVYNISCVWDCYR